MNSELLEPQLVKGKVKSTRFGAIVASESGVAVSYGIRNAQERGQTFMAPQTSVYEGMIVGMHNRDRDLELNICKERKISNMRSSTSEIVERLETPIMFSLEEALDFAGKRRVFGKTLAETQTIQRRLADMARRITTARLLSLQLGRLKDEGTMHHSQVSMAKWNNVRAALDIARDARDILGAGGISVEFASIRHMLNLESVITYEGTETIHELSVGRELTGHSAF